MGYTTLHADSYLNLLLNAVPFTPISGNVLGPQAVGSLWLSLAFFNSPPDDSIIVSQQAGELAYGGYERLEVVRDPGDAVWSIADSTANNANTLRFADRVAGDPGVVEYNHVIIGTAESGPGTALLYGSTVQTVLPPGSAANFDPGKVTLQLL